MSVTKKKPAFVNSSFGIRWVKAFRYIFLLPESLNTAIFTPSPLALCQKYRLKRWNLEPRVYQLTYSTLNWTFAVN